MARTTTDAANWRFNFSISDLGRFLGKSPVTLREWERKDFITIPREDSGERRMATDHIRGITKIAHDAGRISKHRRNLVLAAMTVIELIERANGS